jgi:hypothetical protein
MPLGIRKLCFNGGVVLRLHPGRQKQAMALDQNACNRRNLLRGLARAKDYLGKAATTLPIRIHSRKI